MIAGSVDAVIFASPSSLRFAADVLARERDLGATLPALVCIGATTARAASELAFDVAAIAESPATGAIVEAVERALSFAEARACST